MPASGGDILAACFLFGSGHIVYVSFCWLLKLRLFHQDRESNG